MSDSFNDMLDDDMDNVFLNTLEFAAAITRTTLAGVTSSINAAFEFQVGAVDEKERAVFRVKDDVAWVRGDYVTFNSEQFVVIDIRNDDLGMLELRCDLAEVTN